MRRSVVILALLSLACRTGTEPANNVLLGRWVTLQEGLNPQGSAQWALTFAANGRFASEVRTVGVYPGQSSTDVSSYSRVLGTYSLASDKLTVVPDSLIEWDRFYGPDATPTITSPIPNFRLYDDAHFSIAASLLILQYTTYPADAPVSTTRHFTRAN